MTPAEFKEILDYGVPTAILLGVAYTAYRIGKWVAMEFIKPVLGPDGAIVNHLKTQEGESKLQTNELRRMNVALENNWHLVNQRLLDLVTAQAEDAKNSRELRDEMFDMIAIHRHWSDAFQQMATEDPQFQEALRRIKEIAEKYI